jgi:hypothetical protein
MNHPKNLQPLPKYLNSSKESKIETGTSGWAHYVKEGKDILPNYRKFLARRQEMMRDLVNKKIKEISKGNRYEVFQ